MSSRASAKAGWLTPSDNWVWINEVTLRQARLVLGWVTYREPVNRLSTNAGPTALTCFFHLFIFCFWPRVVDQAGSDVNKDLGLKAKDSRYQGQIFHRSSPYSAHHFFIVNVV